MPEVLVPRVTGQSIAAEAGVLPKTLAFGHETGVVSHLDTARAHEFFGSDLRAPAGIAGVTSTARFGQHHRLWQGFALVPKHWLHSLLLETRN